VDLVVYANLLHECGRVRLQVAGIVSCQISLLVADDMFGQIPPLEKDLYFGEPPPDALPYTKSAARAMSQPHLGSTADLRSDGVGMLSSFCHLILLF